MKTKHCHLHAGVLMLATAVTGCATGTGGIEPQDSHAIFSSFSYMGNDDFYAANPPAGESSYYNPILPGWYSDPSICADDKGNYYLVTSTFTYYPGVPLFHSRDLVNWKQTGYVLDRPSQLKNLEKQHVSGGIFAPDIAYNPANKTYYMVTTNVGAGNFFVKTQNPAEGWSDPIMLPEVQGIDPAFFFDEDGKAYIVNNDDAPDNEPEYPGHRTVRIVEFDTATDRCVGERRIIVNKGVRPQDKPIWCEGPHIYKIDGRYYLMTAEGGTSTQHSEVIYRGNSPMGPFEPWEGNPILTQRTLDSSRSNPVTCAGHADLVKAPDGSWWSVFLACRPIENDIENLGRETFMLPVRWTDDGWPYITREGETVAMQFDMPGTVRDTSSMTGNFTWEENFTDSILGPEWHTLRGPATEYYSLTSNPGHLTLRCGDVNSTDKAVLPFVCRRIQHHKYTASTTLTFVPAHDRQCAGMLLFKDELHQYFLGKALRDGSQHIVLRRISDTGTEELAFQALEADNSSVDLRVESKGLSLDFAYSTDNGSSWQTLASDLDAAFMSTAKAGGFTGTTIGLYASDVE